MWKSFSVRSSAAALALALVFGIAACSEQDTESATGGTRAKTVVEPDNRWEPVAQEEPAVARSQWRLANEQARDVTGNLRVSLAGARGGPVVFAFATGVTVRAQPNAVSPASNRSGVEGRSFAQLYGGDPRVDTHLYRVLDETVSASAPRGGLCGTSRTTHLAVSEFVDQRGRWVFKLAAFRGSGPPGVNGVNPDYCATYAFDAP